MNGHVNNVNYAVWAMDAVDLEVALEKPLREITINYNSEIKAGDKVMLYRHREESKGVLRFYVEGRVEGKSSFVAQLDF